MNNNLLKVSSIVIAALIFMPLGILALSGSASPVYENDGEEHLIMTYAMPEGSVDGLVGNEWPASSQVGSLWCTGLDEPVGKIYMVHDDGVLFIGAKVTYPASQMANDGHWIRIDWDRDSSMDVVDNMGNSVENFAYSDNGFEYAIPINQELIVDDKFNLLLHAQMTGLPSAPGGETTSFPFREPGQFFTTTMVLDTLVPNEPPVALISYYTSGPTINLDARNSYDTDGRITSYSWDFGDDSQSSGKALAHVYEASGQYLVELTVADNDGAVSQSTALVTITVPEPDPEPEPIPEPEPEPITDPEFTGPPNLSYTIEYYNNLDYTSVSSWGIYFYSSGDYPDQEHGIPFNSTYCLPAEDYGTYPLYNSNYSLHFKIHITNHDSVAYSDISVTAIQERHNTVTLWDGYGEFQVTQGEPLTGSPEEWLIDLNPSEEMVLFGYHVFTGRGYGLDQTHVIISHDGINLHDDSEAGVYCPP